jgi:hypothetical protein
MTMGAAHVLEMPQKLALDAQFYAAVNGTLYRYFAVAGAVLQLGTLGAAAALAYWLRGTPSVGGVLAGLALAALSPVRWAVLVQPVNSQVSAALQQGPASLPEVWMRLRPRWEFGHTAAFAAWLGGFISLTAAAVRQIPQGETPGEPVARSASPRCARARG